MIKFSSATNDHVKELSKDIKKGFEEEVHLLGEPLEAITNTVTSSEIALSVYVNNSLYALCGVRKYQHGKGGVVWMVPTNLELTNVEKKEVLKKSKEVLHLFYLMINGPLYNHVATSNRRALAYCKYLGFTIWEPEDISNKANQLNVRGIVYHGR